MRTAMMAILAAGAVAGLSTIANAQSIQRSLQPQNQGRVSQEAYNRCLQLALKRGQNMSPSDNANRELFIAYCLQGKIPF
jgi:hypothetical protein